MCLHRPAVLIVEDSLQLTMASVVVANILHLLALHNNCCSELVLVAVQSKLISLGEPQCSQLECSLWQPSPSLSLVIGSEQHSCAQQLRTSTTVWLLHSTITWWMESTGSWKCYSYFQYISGFAHGLPAQLRPTITLHFLHLFVCMCIYTYQVHNNYVNTLPCEQLSCNLRIVTQSPANKYLRIYELHPLQPPILYIGSFAAFKCPVGSVFQNISSAHEQNILHRVVVNHL